MSNVFWRLLYIGLAYIGGVYAYIVFTRWDLPVLGILLSIAAVGFVCDAHNVRHSEQHTTKEK